MKNQRGFATLEMILVILIIAVLSTIVLPKAARMVDTVRLDYEMKIFLSTLDFAKSLNQNAFYQKEIFKDVNLVGKPAAIKVNLETTKYSIVRDLQTTAVRIHQLPKDFSVSWENGLTNVVYFSRNNNGHVILTSPQNSNRYIIFNSVGRWRGDITAPK